MESTIAFSTFTFICASLGFSLILWAKKNAYKPLSWLVVPARKSQSGAVLLGGLIIFCSTFFGMCWLNYIGKMSYFHLVSWGSSGSILAVLGYLDDRKELRPFAKLAGQFLASYVFANLCGFYMREINPVIFVNVLLFLGLASFNGSNLIDGLDTISAKTSIVSYLSYFALGHYLGLESVPLISALLVMPMASFWYFNKSSSRIHMGEIGGGIIGLSLLFLAFVTYSSLSRTNLSSWQLAHLSIFGLLLPTVELGVSFMRRLMAGKTPFSGDQKHMHHILCHHYKFGAKKTANFIALVHLCVQSVIVFVALRGWPIAAFWLGVVMYTSVQVIVGHKVWSIGESSKTPITYIMSAIHRKDVLVIPAEMFDDVNFDLSPIKDDQDEAA